MIIITELENYIQSFATKIPPPKYQIMGGDGLTVHHQITSHC